jgi:hypothetical protein
LHFSSHTKKDRQTSQRGQFDGFLDIGVFLLRLTKKFTTVVQGQLVQKQHGLTFFLLTGALESEHNRYSSETAYIGVHYARKPVLHAGASRNHPAKEYRYRAASLSKREIRRSTQNRRRVVNPP